MSKSQGAKPILTQSRKKAIMEQVEGQRRRNKIISISAILLIVVVVVAVVIALPRTGNEVPLPGYLDHCVVSTLVYHSHPSLSITVNGSSVGIPSGVGIGGACNHPVHTHTADGVLHVETDESRDYTLGDFFLIWGNHDNDAQRAIFNSTEIFGAHATGGHALTMTVTINNGNPTPSSEFQNYVLPRTACESASACQQQPSFQQTSIAIVYA
jgi:hypothetical protein